jgi:NAD(P)-dependent dehydrogenase (short-subunit alcohol dehydrogenase family)
MEKPLQQKIALVTGGSRGIGRETALRLAEKGADVIVTYLAQEAAAERTAAELRGLGVRGGALRADLTGTGDLDRFAAALRSLLSGWGRERLDILVNNAGILRLAPFDRVTEAELDANYLTNFKSVFFLTQKLLPVLADGGRIVNLGSRTAGVAFAPLVSYGPLKAAVQSLTLYLASHLGKRRITVNAVSPGGLDDDFNKGLFEQMPQTRGYLAGNTALGRIGVPQDVASVIAFLCTHEASFINGAVIQIDGGYKL